MEENQTLIFCGLSGVMLLGPEQLRHGDFGNQAYCGFLAPDQGGPS